MRLANISGRLSLVTSEDQVIDLSMASGGRLGPDMQSAYEQWDLVCQLAKGLQASPGTSLSEIPRARFENPAPRPRQTFAIGLNYAAHAREAALAVPEDLTVFTKFVSSFTGPYGMVTLPEGTVDWEIELVVVIGRGGYRIGREDAWSHIAGVTAGQDLSERTRQAAGPAPQYSLAKSFPGFGPMGPVLVTPDEYEDPDAIELGCSINGEQVQQGNTNDMVFPVPEIIARLSAITPLLPGDVIFTGTPPGVGVGRIPRRFLKPGDELTSYVQGVGEMSHRMMGKS